MQRVQNIKIDILIVAGDFQVSDFACAWCVDVCLCCVQAVRNESDLACLTCPEKHRHMRTFFKYYSGEKKAPVLTLYIGGNHEASNIHVEL